jgi:hypothetical protein
VFGAEGPAGRITLLVLGPQTGVARLLDKHPDCKPWIKRIVVMGGALQVGQNGQPPALPEWNIKSDVAAAKAVLAAGVPLTYVPLDVTHKHVLSTVERDRLFAAQTMLTQQLQLLYQLADEEQPQLHDAVAAAVAIDQPQEGPPAARKSRSRDAASWGCETECPRGGAARRRQVRGVAHPDAGRFRRADKAARAAKYRPAGRARRFAAARACLRGLRDRYRAAVVGGA